MTWPRLVDRLFRRRRFGIEPGLERIAEALDREGNPNRDYGVVTVAGTNGKGTVASLIAALLQQRGERVGLYTSPHLIDVRERFRVDGRPLSERELATTLERFLDVYRFDDAGQGPGLTFFELTTLLAADAFRRQQIDWAVFEVGLGGRLDAVNAIDPDATAVATIGFDHTGYLGETIEEIAGEKAGIFRPGVPAVVGQQDYPEALSVLRNKAAATGAHLIEAFEDSSSDNRILARHRQTALRTAEAALSCKYSSSQRSAAFSRWRWPGRYDERTVGDGGQRLYLDAAHNADAVGSLREAIRRRARPIEGVVWGAMADKKPGEVQEWFGELDVPVWGAVVDNQRSRTTAQLRRFVPSQLWKGATETSTAVDEALETTDGDVLVFGSVYLLGEVYEALGVDPSSLVTWGGDCHRVSGA